jgi:hypothetical protein
MSMKDDPGGRHMWLSDHAFPFRLAAEQLPDGSERFAERDFHRLHVAIIVLLASLALTAAGVHLMATSSTHLGVLGVVHGVGIALVASYFARRDCEKRSLICSPSRDRVIIARTRLSRMLEQKDVPLSELQVVLRPVEVRYTDLLRWSGVTVLAVVDEDRWLALCCVRTREEAERLLRQEWPSWVRERFIGEGPLLTANGSRRIGFGYG